MKKPFDTRIPSVRKIWQNEFYGKWGNGTPLSERGLPDWTEGIDLVEFIEESEYDFDAIILDEGATGGYGTEVMDRGVSVVVRSSNQVKSATDNIGTFDPTNPDIRFQQRDAADDKAYAEEAKAHFGKTYSYNKAGYIVTDGSMLDFSGKHEGYDSGARSVDHREIWEVRERDDMSGTEAMIDFMAAGNIRLSPESGGFNLIVAPTKAQEYTLSSYISEFRGEVIVDIDNERGETIHSFEYNRGTHSSRVLNDLRAYFENGTLPEAQSNLAQFLYQQRDPDQISDRELLATALQSVTRNADEWDNLRRYQNKIAALDEKQRRLEHTNARIAELKGRSDRESKDELIRLQNNVRTLTRSIDRADGELLKYEAMKPIRNLAERQREDYRQKLKTQTDERIRKYRDRMKQDMQERIREVREREAQRGRQRLDKAVERAREVGQRRVDRLKESEARSKYKERIQKDVSTLREWLTQPTNKGHVPQFLRVPLADFLESLDFTSARALKGGDATQADRRMLEKMDALRRALTNTRNQQADIENGEAAYRDYLDLPEGFSDEFDAAVANIRSTLEQGGTDIPINRMTAEQLKTLSNMIRTINTAVRTANSFLASRRYQTVSEAARDSISTLAKQGAKSVRNAILEKVGGFLDWMNATPYYVFKRFGDGGKAVFEGLMDGWDRLAFNSRQMIDYANSTYTTKQVREWSQELHTINLNGRQVQMTTAQIMSLYCLNKRAQARGHLYGGGIRIADIRMKGKTITQADNHILSIQNIAGITRLLTAEQRSVADRMQEFMNTVCTEWGNEVSMQRFGYKAFGDEANYFPIETDSNNRRAIDEQAQENSLFRLLNLSATKNTVKGANNALVVRDIFDVFSAHCADMAKYNALALPILDALKWYNYVEKTKFDDGSLSTASVQKALEKAYGKDAQKYIKSFLRDLNGVREGGQEIWADTRVFASPILPCTPQRKSAGKLRITWGMRKFWHDDNRKDGRT